MYLLFLILSLAVLSDFSVGRIPNALTLGGFVLSQVWVCSTSSVYSAVISLMGVFMLICVLFPLFSIGCLGGGDIKLLMVLPGFVGVKETAQILWVALILAGCIGICKLHRHRELKKRILYLADYLLKIGKTGRLTQYESSLVTATAKVNQIHFSFPILVATVIVTKI